MNFRRPTSSLPDSAGCDGIDLWFFVCLDNKITGFPFLATTEGALLAVLFLMVDCRTGYGELSVLRAAGF